MVLGFRNIFFDLVRLFGKLSPSRVVNLVWIYTGFWLSRLARRVVVLGNPFSISAEVSSLCNLRCPQCPQGMGAIQRADSSLSVEVFRRLARMYQKSVFYANLYFQGEPFLNPELPQLVKVAADHGFYTCVSTNGHFLNEKTCNEIIAAGLDRLIVSLDGLDQAAYSFYRQGGNWQQVVDGFSTMARVRAQRKARNPLLVLQFLVSRQNESQIPALKKFARTLGADMVQLKSMQVYQNKDSYTFLPLNKKYNRYYPSKANPSQHRNGSGVPCFRLWSHVVFTSDGTAVPCCYDKIPEYSLKNKEGENHWISPDMHTFRRKVMFQRSKIGICCNCAG